MINKVPFLFDHFLDARADIMELVFLENWRHHNFLLKLPDLHVGNNQIFHQKSYNKFRLYIYIEDQYNHCWQSLVRPEDM